MQKIGEMDHRNVQFLDPQADIKIFRPYGQTKKTRIEKFINA